MTASPTDWWNDPLELAREASLFALNVAAVVSLGRLFVGSDHLAPLLLHAAIAHVVIGALRRTNRSLALAAVVASGAAALTTILVFHPGSTVLGFPTTNSIDLVSADLDTAFSLFGDAPTPTAPLTGFLMLCAAALWVSAFVADWAAFRLDVPIEAMLPAATVFVFGAVLADDHQRTVATAVALAAAMSFLLIHRVSRQARTSQWVAGASQRGSSALLGSGAVILLAAVVLASISGPSLPGAGAEPLVELEPGNDAPRSRVTVSPLVDIRRRLVDQANVQVFTVVSDQRAYWRLTSLDTFDGRIWSSSGSYGRAEGSLEPSVESAPEFDSTTQTFAIDALAAIWLPAAYEPRSIEADLDLRYDEFSSTLIVDTDIIDSDGITYTVESDLPRVDAATLQSAGTLYPTEVLDTHLLLPGDLPQSVRNLAAEVADGAATPYDASIALQNFLRGFRYELSVPSGHSGNDLERFLLADQAGYCEQFAGSFAAMARALGIPSRVAVGFTPGIETAPGVYSVRGEHAHAWPEVYFPGAGWVPFEPTPQRGAPNAENYTGVAEQQVSSGGDPNTATTLAPPVDEPDPAEPDSPQIDDNVDAASPARPADTPQTSGDTSADTGFDLQSWATRLAVVFATVLTVVSLYVAGALLITSRRRDRRRFGAGTPPAKVQVAWDESLEALRLLGLADDPTATHGETVGRATAVLPTGHEHATVIGALAEAAVYGPSGIGDVEVVAAEHAAGAIATVVNDSTTLAQRARNLLNPRTLFGIGPIRKIGRD